MEELGMTNCLTYQKLNEYNEEYLEWEKESLAKFRDHMIDEDEIRRKLASLKNNYRGQAL